MKQLLLGLVAMASFVAGLFFLRFWRDTKDRFFMLFAAAFTVEGINRIALGLVAGTEEATIVYLVRFLAFTLILIAFIDKNLAERKGK